MSFPNQSLFNNLFWDIDIQSLDIQGNRNFIIQRLLEKGNNETLKWVFKNYSIPTIKFVVQNSPNLSEKTRNFWQTFFNKYAQIN